MSKYGVIFLWLGLAALSLVMLRSIAPDLVVRQTLAFSLGLGSIWFLSHSSFATWLKLSPWAYAGLLVSLGLVLLLGIQTRGTVGWFELPGGFKLQPSQLAVPLTSLFLLYQFPISVGLTSWRRVAGFLVSWLGPALLIALEPDFGSLMVYLGGTGMVLLFYRIPLRWWLGLAGIGLGGLALAWVVVFKPYQRDRILSFLHPSGPNSQVQVETSAQYNARQALIAVGSGGWVGRGLGYGIQSHLRFLPERQTDFIFASLSEELGFLGSSMVLVSYVGLLWFLIRLALAQQLPSKTAFLLSYAGWVFVQAAINLGMNVGLLPITGITLPFLSYGGSSILGLSLGLGIVQLISQETRKKLVLHIR